MKIITFKSQYAQAIYDFVMDIKVNELGWKLDAVDLYDIPKNYLSGKGNFWLAIDDNKIIGTVALKDIGNNQGYLKRMYLTKEYRGTGLAKEMLDILIKYAKSKGFKEIYLGTVPAPHTQRAMRFYEKNAFVHVPKLPETFTNDTDSYFYKFDLK